MNVWATPKHNMRSHLNEDVYNSVGYKIMAELLNYNLHFVKI